MKTTSACFALVLLALAGCSADTVTLFDGKSALSKTEKGEFTVSVTLRPDSTVKSAEVSFDALIAAARSEVKHYTEFPDVWKFDSIQVSSIQGKETAYLVQFRQEWEGWIIIVVGADGSIRSRPEAR